jgi:MerR family copper efflux transcriptional regulator
MTSLTISQLARRSGVPTTTLRYYEKIGVLPPTTRAESGYRIYDEDALARIAFVQRAKALGVALGDLGDLVRLWDGEECAPVQERLRSLVHEQRAATRRRLEELTQLAADLETVGATIGDAACGPDCACLQPATSVASELPLASERLVGAACTLNSEEMRERLAEWRGVRDRATSIDDLPGGIRLTFTADEPVAPIADLVSRESECCAFYTCGLRIDGPVRQLDISAGAGGEPAVRALLGLEQ